MSIKLEKVSYIYNPGTVFEKEALHQISLEISKGEFVALIGHTGSGKSTLIQLLNGLLKPTEGKVRYYGENIWDPSFDRRQLRFHVGIAFQYPEQQLFEDTVIDDVCFGPLNKGLSAKEARQKAAAALAMTGIEEPLFERSPFELSGGQKRRAAIAGVLAMEPDIFILDEPGAGLDPRGRIEILDMLKELQRKKKITVILVSHSMEEAAGYADRIIVLTEGRIAFDDVPNRVFGHYIELEQMGLCAPAAARLMQELRRRGFPVNTGCRTIEEAKESILKVIGR